MKRLPGIMTRIAVAVAVLGIASCGKDPNKPYPVRGIVLFNDKPAEGAVVTFVPTANTDPKALRPSGVVLEDGTFQLSTKKTFDGAAVGTYAVTIFYLSPEKKADGQNAGPDLLKGKYTDPATTPLKAEVKPEPNTLEPFRLP